MARRAPRPYHHGDLRRALMEAALALVSDGGLPALSLREAARRAGVSVAAPYHHFASREALIAALAVEGFAGMRASMEAELAAADDEPVERLLASGRGYLRYALAHPASFQIMFGAPRLCDVSQFPEVASASAPVGEILARGVEGVLALPGLSAVPAARLALLAWSSVHGMAWLVLDGAAPPSVAVGNGGGVDPFAPVEALGALLRAAVASP